MPDKTVVLKTPPLSLVGSPRTSPTLDPTRKVPELESRRTYNLARMAVNQKYMEIGGATGLPTGPLESATGVDFTYLRRYQNGIIYWQESIGARWVHGAILGKYQELGAEGGFLGFPTTDETGAPDGVGRYNHFERGSIYWTPGTGAREVHGMIRDKWQSLGWERSWLGYPISDEMDFPENGRVSVFQNGSIYWWADTGARELNDVVVQYTGLFCFGETDADVDTVSVLGIPVPVPSDDDEPFASIGVKGPGVENTFRTQIYEVNAGDARPDLIELYRGKPRGLLINALLTEFSGGDTDLSRQKIKEAYEKASPYVAQAITEIPYVGPVLGPIAEFGLAAAKGAILNALNDFVEHSLGYANRPLGEDAITLSARDMVLLATRPEGNAFQYAIAWRFETALLSRFGASYKIYFNILGA
jgi:LGFP repeat